MSDSPGTPRWQERNAGIKRQIAAKTSN